jgi:hypothetical protein
MLEPQLRDQLSLAGHPEMASTHRTYNRVVRSGRPRCPVCHKDVYSLSGIHPQCAFKWDEVGLRDARKIIADSLERVHDEALLAEG